MLLPTLLLALTAVVQEPEAPPIAIIHVTVLPMHTDQRLTDHTVIVAGERILAVGPTADIEVPEGARVVDGQGQFLMPGLVDFHVHTYFETDHKLFLANGVTTVRNLFGNPMHLALRARLESGELLGPTLLT
ncbi:MAG: amidohydrolase, partial [Planctomycetota bacterium]|nr:amidohydrolase [Planctomycetota bacterium]